MADWTTILLAIYTIFYVVVFVCESLVAQRPIDILFALFGGAVWPIFVPFVIWVALFPKSSDRLRRRLLAPQGDR